MPPIRFYWLETGVLAGASRPGARPGRRDADPVALDEDLAALRGHGIGALLSLTETPLPADALERHGIAGLHLPVPDFHPPATEQFREAIAFIELHRAAGTPVAVHCLAGQGRTGSVLAASLIRRGSSADEAIAAVRAVCPGAVETRVQVEALRELARDRWWIA